MTGDPTLKELREAAQRHILTQLAAEDDPGKAATWAKALEATTSLKGGSGGDRTGITW